jgi:hypothetical protein
MILRRELPWAGVFGGFLFWYLAHDIGFYFSGHGCNYSWVPRVIHVVCFLGAVFATFLSFRTWRENKMTPLLNVSAGALFSLVILWQGIATFVYAGCER